MKASAMCVVGFVVSAAMQVVLFATYELRLFTYSVLTRRLVVSESAERSADGGHGGEGVAGASPRSLRRGGEKKDASVGLYSKAEAEHILAPHQQTTHQQWTQCSDGGACSHVHLDMPKVPPEAQPLTGGVAGDGGGGASVC